MTQRSSKKRANLRDVARVANVSVATVSRVLNSPEVVNEETRRKVEEVIQELKFVRSAAARAINTGRTKVVGALIPTLDNAIFARTLDAMESRLDEFGLSLVVATTDEKLDVEARKAQELLDIGVEGLFLTGITHSPTLYDLIDHVGVPAVAISYFDSDYLFPTIGYDNRRAALMALEHLQSSGHKRIAIVHGPAARSDRTRGRLAGITSRSNQLDLSFFETTISIGGGSAAVQEALAGAHEFDAFLCISDVLAMGVLFELQRSGLSVPDDVSVMGLDGLPSAAITAPRLSTVKLPSPDMGSLAAEALANWVEHDVRPEPNCLPTELLIRESTRKRN